MKLSVVTPSLNQARYLGACLASVRLAAENAPACEVEHLVIDGGSTDGTIDLLRGQTAVRWVSEQDSGQSQAINYTPELQHKFYPYIKKYRALLTQSALT